MTSNDFRETTIRIAGVERVIRTERVGKVKTVKQLEAAHLAAVKAGITAIRLQRIDEDFQTETTAEDEASERRRWHSHHSMGRQGPMREETAKTVDDMVRYSLDERRKNMREYGEKLRGKAAPRNVSYLDAMKSVKPFPKVRFTDQIPEYLVEVEPGHYATAEVAEEDGYLPSSKPCPAAA
ncbi:hypothetical protein [Streptomyces umbrinus]|uniref:hypothetical protein n=1 Tax=Streptomyces umbrinus TaxID=67370 RepID=UPI0034407F92